MVEAVYERIGAGYTATRRTDPRIAEQIWTALGRVRSVLNVGAGTGAYEPRGRAVVAVEPSMRMIHQRPGGGAPAVRGVAEALPFRSGTFDAALAALTLHHWSDWRSGLAEMQRVANRIVIFTAESGGARGFWLTDVYFPEIADLDRHRFPAMADIVAALGPSEVQPVAVPHDCADGFLAAFWRRPEAYLDPAVRAAMSGFAQLDPAVVARGVERLCRDLESGAWDQQFGHLRSLEALDVCYRLVIAPGR